MAELEVPSRATPAPASYALSRQQFQTIAWLRWRIFLNSMRGKGAAGELVVRVLSYPLVALMIFGPAVGVGAGSWYLVQQGLVSYLAIPFWIVFALWQFIGVSTSATGPSFDLATLARFPIRYRDYFLIRLAFGLLDIPTLSGCACLIAMGIGIGAADPRMLPIALPILIIYGVANILFSRMVYSWFERWMAQRRTRELATILILVLSLAIQFGSQFLGRLNTAKHHHGQPSPLMLKASGTLLAVNWALPPGVAALSIDRYHAGLLMPATIALGGLFLYCVSFLLILHIRLQKQYLGENLSEAPVSGPPKASVSRSKLRRKIFNASTPSIANSAAISLLSPAISACLTREVRYLLRSGPKLYALVMPVFMILLFSFRMAGLDSVGIMRGSSSYLFTYGCAYTQLILVSMLYNSLGGDGSGIQFYFIAPIRFRDVMLAKNLLTGAILILEIILMYIVAAIVSKPAPPALTAATLSWMLFTILINMSIGNVRSVNSPKVVEAGRLRRQNVSGMNSLISLGVVILAITLGSTVQFLCNYFGVTYWVAALAFLALSAIALILYFTVLRQLDKIADEHRDDLIRELCKA